MENWLFPWESHVMLSNPIAMPVFMLMVSIVLSIFSWIRQRK
ncbi:hypothetical protein [Bacillus tuaregi]|nr:hypothetical protein [Bacillus tuaregi]